MGGLQSTLLLAVTAEAAARGAGRLVVPLLAALVVVAASRGAFVLFARACRFLDRDDRPTIAESLVLGWPLFGLLCFLLALITTERTPLVVLTIVTAAAGLLTVRFQRQPSAVTHDRSDYLGIALLTVAAVITLLFAQLPAVTLDEVAYHLAVPRIWIATGRAVELPLLSHSYFPFALESSALPLLSMLGSRGAVAVHFVHALMAAAGTLVVARRVGRGRWLYAAAILCTPALLVTAGWAWVDFELTILAALLFFALRDLAGGRPGGVRGALALAGGLSVKYTFGPLALLLFVVASVARKRQDAEPGESGSRSSLVRVAVAGGVIGSAFFIRNLFLTGRPFEPMFSEAGRGAFGYRSLGGPFSQLMTYLFDVRFVDEALGCSMLVLVIAALLAARRLNRFDRGVAVSSSLLCVVLFFLAPSARILVPFLVIPAVIGAGVIDSRPLRLAVALFTVIQLSVLGLYSATQGVTPLLSGAVSEDQYLRQYRRSYPDARWLSEQMPPGSRTLVVGSLELFWFDGDVRGGGNFDGARVARYLDAPESVLSARLRGDGITHIAILRNGIVPAPSDDVRRRERETVLPELAAAQFRRFIWKQELVAQNGSAVLLRLR